MKSLFNEETVLTMLEVIGDLRREVSVLRQVLQTRGVVTKEDLDMLNREAQKQLTPFRVQIEQAVETARKFQALDTPESGGGKKPQ